MQTYPEMAQTYLQKNNPTELQRLKKKGKLNEFLQDVEEVFGEQETEIIAEMSEKLPKETVERMKSLEQAQRVAREATTRDLTEFLDNL